MQVSAQLKAGVEGSSPCVARFKELPPLGDAHTLQWLHDKQGEQDVKTTESGLMYRVLKRFISGASRRAPHRAARPCGVGRGSRVARRRARVAALIRPLVPAGSAPCCESGNPKTEFVCSYVGVCLGLKPPRC